MLKSTNRSVFPHQGWDGGFNILHTTEKTHTTRLRGTFLATGRWVVFCVWFVSTVSRRVLSYTETGSTFSIYINIYLFPNTGARFFVFLRGWLNTWNTMIVMPFFSVNHIHLFYHVQAGNKIRCETHQSTAYHFCPAAPIQYSLNERVRPTLTPVVIVVVSNVRKQQQKANEWKK